MKIVHTDNFDRELYPETIICENVPKYYAQFITDSLNKKYCVGDSDFWAKAVEDDYILFSPY